MASPKIPSKISLAIPPYLLLLAVFSVHLSCASNFISVSQSLSGPDRLVSEGGNFVLGFFQPGSSPYYYVGIWYSLTMFSEFTAVWVANREIPISNPLDAELKISADGNLVLSLSSQQIWSTNTTITSNSTLAVLLDTGNLVLRDGSNSNVTLWQSVDHPTDTWLPGGKLGLNKVTGEFQRLVSWKSKDDPAPGAFSVEMDTNGSSQFFLVWNNSFSYWTSGLWNGRIFSLVPEMTANFWFDFKLVSNSAVSYYTYSTRSNNPVISRFMVDSSGNIKQWTWIDQQSAWILFWAQPGAPCEVHALCGPFGTCVENTLPFCNCIKGFRAKSPSDWGLRDWTGGCVRNTPLQCEKNSSDQGQKDRFYTMSNMSLPDNAQSIQVGSASDCESGCLKNCLCTAYSYGSGGCSIWHGNLLNLRGQYDASSGGTISLRVAASELRDSKTEGPSLLQRKKIKEGVVIAPVVMGALTLLIFTLFLTRKRMRRRAVTGKSKVVENGLVAFKFSELQRVTKNFSEKLGGGSFGSVFKGILSDSTPIAVKKLEGYKQGEKQFWSEVRTIGTTQHVNLVRLHGFCSEKKQHLLVYEYMPNGSLDTKLFRNESNQVLDWNTRYQIALGTAQGLTYLHEHCRDCIIHCDIKPENILLDASFVPKIADFGLAKLLGRDLSRILTTMRGTIGYLAPEWISGMSITAKADVYSYGMMLFEIISGKRNLNLTEEGARFFPTLAARRLIEGDVVGLLDPKMEGDTDLEEVIRVCKVACWCIQDHVNSRPSMRQVVQILEGILEVEMPPVPRILQILADHSGSIDIFSELSSNLGPLMDGTSTKSETEAHL